MDKHNISFEPMDIDLSAHSSNDMDVSFNESTSEIDAIFRKRDESTETSLPGPPGNDLPTYTNLKKFHINIKKDTANTHSATKIKVICAALVLFLSGLAYQLLNIHCSHDIKPVQLRKSLSGKLYGQMKAIDALIEGFNTNERSKVLILYGSTGVGKTFATSILQEHLGPCSNVYHYTMPSFMDTFTTDFMVGLTLCKDTIVIIDDLSLKDNNIKDHINKLLAKSESLEKILTVLLIYNNCNHGIDFTRQCDEYFPAKIIDDLKQIKTYKKVIRFETLTEEHLLKCIETELGHRKVTDNELKKILKNFDVTVDGCKGVHTKMKLLDFS